MAGICGPSGAVSTFDEDRLDFDPVRLRMTLSGRGSRQQTGDSLAVERLVPETVGFVEKHPGCSQRAVGDALNGRAEHVRKALRLAEDRGLIRTERGPKNALLHYRDGVEVIPDEVV